jgi:filamentous hemagglutinin
MKASLGDEKALKLTKDLIMLGVSPSSVNSLPATAYTDLNELVVAGAKLTGCGALCSGSQSVGNSVGSSSLGLVPLIVNPDEMESFLESVARFANSSGAQNAVTVMAVVQATMGPWKFAFNLAAKAALDATVGDGIDQKNEEAAIALVARWKGIDSTKIAQLNEEDKARHANGEEDVPFEGSTDVVGVKYLIESVEDAIVGSVGKATVRAIGITSTNGGMLGENGVKTFSKTIWKGTGKERLDVENPNPGQRAGQIHYQDNAGNKYLYDPLTNTFPGAPKAVNKLLDNPRFMQAISKGMSKYLGE